MVSYKKYAFSPLLAIFILSSCSLFSFGDDDNTLPKATMSGKITFGCRVNGEVWIPKGNDGTPNWNASWSSDYGGVMQIGVYRASNTEFEFMQMNPINVTGPGEYNLTSSDYILAFFINGSCTYDDYGIVQSGKLVISKLDFDNQIVSGTFFFNLRKANCEDVAITDGRFDLKF